MPCNSPNLADSKKTKIIFGTNFVEKNEAHILYFILSSAKSYYFRNDKIERTGCILWEYVLFYAHCFLYTKSGHNVLHGAASTHVIYNGKHVKPRCLLHGNILRLLCFHLRFQILKKETMKAAWIWRQAFWLASTKLRSFTFQWKEILIFRRAESSAFSVERLRVRLRVT